MRNNTTYTHQKPTAPDELLKITSLLYFKEALRNQQYEDCPALLKTAKRFGARRGEIRQVIDEVTGRGKAGRHTEADDIIGGRLRQIEEE